MIKKLLIFLATIMLCLPCSGKKTFDWDSNPFSIFIHYGLYSGLGGTWQGCQIREGYSEQIRAFAKISKEDYAALASTFCPDNFNADSIASLAREAGAGSIVITAKHHDGFCLYPSAANPFNISISSSRDLIKELSLACSRHGLGFGLYYSLIDWNFTNIITGHNADPVSSDLHNLNLAQVRELLSNYGPISELWFDMGCLSPSQSEQIYKLVHSLQNDCRVSSRLGNNFADFIVMPDNTSAEEYIGIPWQSPVSIFPETWGYRSWQQRIPADKKAAEMLGRLKHVNSLGGHFLLNIGPDGSGAVIPYEKEVLQIMGSNPVAKAARISTKIPSHKYSYAYAGLDYYTSFRTRIAKRTESAKKESTLYFTEEGLGKELEITKKACLVGKKKKTIKLVAQAIEAIGLSDMGLAQGQISGPVGGALGKIVEDSNLQWSPFAEDNAFIPLSPRKSIYYSQEIQAPRDGYSLVKIGYTTAVMVFLNNEELVTYISPDDSSLHYATVLLPLNEGHNSLKIKLYNRFGPGVVVSVNHDIPQQLYRMPMKGVKEISLPKGQVYGPVLQNIIYK